MSVAVDDLLEHAKLSPSGSKKWFACPGSLVLEAPIPNRSSIYSDDGTAKHWVAAECLNNDLEAANFVGEFIAVNSKTEEPRHVRFTDEMADVVQAEVDQIRAIAAGAVQVFIEKRVDFSDVVDEPGSFGTLDIGILHASTVVDGWYELDIRDFKFGHKPVEVEANTQLMIYALGLYNELSLAYDIRRIRLAIHQPRAAGTTEWTCSVEDLLAFAELVRGKAAQVRMAERNVSRMPPEEWQRIYLNPNPNEEECAFCRAMPTCPSAQRKLQETVGAAFDVITDGTLPDAKVLLPADLATVMAASGFIEDFIKSARAETERRLLAGEEVAGFGLELGRKGARRFRNEAEALALVRDTWRLKMEHAFDWSLKSPTSYEKMTKPIKGKDADGNPVVEPPLIGPKRWKAMQELIVQNDPKPSVKRASEIKTPYVPPVLDGSDFSTVKE